MGLLLAPTKGLGLSLLRFFFADFRCLVVTFVPFSSNINNDDKKEEEKIVCILSPKKLNQKIIKQKSLQ